MCSRLYKRRTCLKLSGVWTIRRLLATNMLAQSFISYSSVRFSGKLLNKFLEQRWVFSNLEYKILNCSTSYYCLTNGNSIFFIPISHLFAAVNSWRIVSYLCRYLTCFSYACKSLNNCLQSALKLLLKRQVSFW